MHSVLMVSMLNWMGVAFAAGCLILSEVEKVRRERLGSDAEWRKQTRREAARSGPERKVDEVEKP